MHDEESEELQIDEEAVIDEFLGDKPRASRLKSLRLTLEQRRRMLQNERDSAKDTHIEAQMNAKITELNKQISALHEEESITEFVEQSVRVTLHKTPGAEVEEDY